MAHGVVAWLFLEPDTVQDHCPRILLSCFRAGTSDGRSDEGDSGYAAPPARIVDDTWIEPEGDSKGFLFHFAHAGNGIDWSDADRLVTRLLIVTM